MSNLVGDVNITVSEVTTCDQMCILLLLSCKFWSNQEVLYEFTKQISMASGTIVL